MQRSRCLSHIISDTYSGVPPPRLSRGSLLPVRMKWTDCDCLSCSIAQLSLLCNQKMTYPKSELLNLDLRND